MFGKEEERETWEKKKKNLRKWREKPGKKGGRSVERKREENLRMNDLWKEKNERYEEIGEDLGERERFWERKRPGIRGREIYGKSNLEKDRETWE